jgi:aerobic-type carbon monoxide dehydrogenase small subunit (CoxS/CutS family)
LHGLTSHKQIIIKDYLRFKTDTKRSRQLVKNKKTLEGKTNTQTASKSAGLFKVQNDDTPGIPKSNIKAVDAKVPPHATVLIKLTVNNKVYEVQVEPNQTLWYILRDKLGLTSPKDMCGGYGACGSCTVIMNGRPILSCMTLAIECNGTNIETAEGIADANHPLIEAYIRNYAIQCGYCTPGFIVAAKALLDRIPRPTEADIRDALGGNICKCSTYLSQIKAVLEAAQELK